VAAVPALVLRSGSEGSCTANSGQGATRLRRAILGMHDFDGARQFLYAMTLS